MMAQISLLIRQNALIYTIGLGPKVTQPSTVDGTHLGELFLQYAADKGNGAYTYAPDTAGLLQIFREIAREYCHPAGSLRMMNMKSTDPSPSFSRKRFR